MTDATGPYQRLDGLKGVVKIDDFRREFAFDYDDALALLDSAIDVLENYYVHLQLKRAMHGVDPIQRLRTMRAQAPRPASDAERVEVARWLVEQLQLTFVALRDMHTGLVPPEPWRSRVAFLPFLVEEYWEGDDPHYVVSKVSPQFPDANVKEGFEAGVEIVEWNWVPIRRLVELIADRNGGSNPAARHARGVDRLTYRWLGASALPDEETVRIGFKIPGSDEVRTDRFRWRVGIAPPSPTARPTDQRTSRAFLHAGRDEYREVGRRVQVALYGEADPAPEAAPWFRWQASDKFPGVVRWAILPDPDGTEQNFGYLRIHSFDVDPVEEFVDEVEGILLTDEMQATSGLIVDVRGNGGGVIDAGEEILQLLTPRTIEPEPLECLASEHLSVLANAFRSPLDSWAPLIDEAIRTGAPLSRGKPVSSSEECNRRGQCYQGYVALVVDALSYSTTDIMAAGFQDHEIGPVLGTSRYTGAGGANVWESNLIDAIRSGRDLMAEPTLPDDEWGLRFAVRCTRRVRGQAGQLLEDLGVKAIEWPLTRADILSNNRDLLAKAIELVKRPMDPLNPRGRLRARRDGNAIELTDHERLERVDLALDGREYASIDVPASTRFDLDGNGGWKEARLTGYIGGHLAASCRLSSGAA